MLTSNNWKTPVLHTMLVMLAAAVFILALRAVWWLGWLDLGYLFAGVVMIVLTTRLTSSRRGDEELQWSRR